MTHGWKVACSELRRATGLCSGVCSRVQSVLQSVLQSAVAAWKVKGRMKLKPSGRESSIREDLGWVASKVKPKVK